MREVLVVGGAGYIGAQTAGRLIREGWRVTVLDDLSTGHRDAVHEQAEFIHGDMADKMLLRNIFSSHSLDAVMHFASVIDVAESVRNPEKYHRHNVERTEAMLEMLLTLPNVPALIFSSSASVYGDAQSEPIDETCPCRPTNPYGESKRKVEERLETLVREGRLKSIALRYFNAAGAHPSGKMGERHMPETHLVPLLMQTASGRRNIFYIYGDDYPTPDGTCIRDFVHVEDIASAHLLAMDYLLAGGGERVFNLGMGKGWSVKDMVRAAERVTGKAIPTVTKPRRDGDPAVLVADGSRAKKLLGWQPKLSDIDTILTHAWAWEKHLMTLG